MKIEQLAVILCAAGAIAAPSWAWKEGSLDKYFKAHGREVYYCQSGGEPVHENDKKFALIMDKGLAKRDRGRDHPEDDKKHKHDDDRCYDHGEDSKCLTKRKHGKDDGPNHDKHDDHGHDGKVKRKHGDDDGPNHDKHDDHGHDGGMKRDHGRDHPEDDKKHHHKGKKCDDHGDDSKCK